jgi:Tol biopolymer transport system component
VLQDDPEIDSSLSPTRTKGTALGAILGTASYMSPEQARGQTVDRRTDIWAFGCCLYEALTGRKAFDGDTVSDILAAVLTRELNGSALDHVPRARLIAERCLEKDPKHRLRDIGDVWLVREERAHRSMMGRWSLAGALGLVVIGAAAGVLTMWLASGSDVPPRDVRRTVVTLPPEAPLARASGADGRVAISPDGRRIAYVADVAGTLQIYVRPLDRLEATPIPGTEGAVALFFSPRSDEIAFIVGDELKRVRLDGGAPLHICNGATNARFAGATWRQDDTILFSTPGEILRVPASGGEPEVWAAADPDRDALAYRQPQRLPDDWVMFSLRGEGQARRVALQPLEGGERLVIDDLPSGTRYADSGHLIYRLGNSIVSAPFDRARGRVTGPPFSLAPDAIPPGPGNNVSRFLDVAENGTLIYWPDAGHTSLTRVAPDGTFRRIGPVANQVQVRVAPDGDRLAVAQHVDSDYDLWAYSSSDAEAPVRLTFGGDNRQPVWTPDGKRIIFTENVAADWRIRSTASDGSQLEPDLVLSIRRGRGFPVPATVSPDGNVLLFYYAGSGSDIVALSLDETREGPRERTLLGSPFNETRPDVAPNGRALAYVSDRSGREEVWLRSFPDVEAHPCSRPGPEEWPTSRDGRPTDVSSTTWRAMRSSGFPSSGAIAPPSGRRGS